MKPRFHPPGTFKTRGAATSHKRGRGGWGGECEEGGERRRLLGGKKGSEEGVEKEGVEREGKGEGKGEANGRVEGGVEMEGKREGILPGILEATQQYFKIGY